MKFFTLLLLLAAVSMATSQQYNDDYPDYQDYADGYQEQEPDSLYQDYAARQEAKELSGSGGGGGGFGLGKLLVSSAASYFVGAKLHSGRTARKMKQKFQKEQKQLYTQYYNDVYKLTEQNQELQYMVEQLQDVLKQTEHKHEMEQLQRDYEEFKQPDIDGDDKISRAEFNMYVKNYLSNYPGLKEEDYPKFSDFDHDGDGMITFQEYAQQMALQAQQAELEQMYGGGNSQKAQAYQDMASGMRR